MNLTEAELEAMLTAAAMVRFVVTGDLTSYSTMVNGYEGDRIVLVNCAVMLAATGAMLTAETTGTDPIAALSDLTARIITQVQG